MSGRSAPGTAPTWYTAVRHIRREPFSKMPVMRAIPMGPGFPHFAAFATLTARPTCFSCGVDATVSSAIKGSIRRSQLVTTYGVGSVVAVEDESFMIAGIDRWTVDGPNLH